MNTTDLLVADVMTIDPVTIDADAQIEDAARLMHAYSVTGLPVVDAGGALVGVISQTDLVAILDSPAGRLIRSRLSGLRVGELMTSPPVTIPMTAMLVEAARTMVSARVHRLVATNDDGRPIGVISAIDFVELFADSVSATVPAR